MKNNPSAGNSLGDQSITRFLDLVKLCKNVLLHKSVLIRERRQNKHLWVESRTVSLQLAGRTLVE
uniref:Uncharacterized protein n=1 Tax=Moorena producens (strain JHB) TaxID=1454205 RepID=A0A1D9FXI3_MOOP1